MMNATVEVGPEVMEKIQRLTTEGRGAADVIKEAVERLLSIHQQRAMRELRGIGWDGDLEEMRTDKPRSPIA